MEITEAISNVSKASAAEYLAKRNLKLALLELSKLSPHKSGDLIDHARYGKCMVFCIRAIPHDEYGAAWEMNVQPILKDQKPSARKIQYLSKI